MATNAQAASILVVDDDSALVTLMVEALREEGYAVRGARSGAEALEQVERQVPDLMLLDLKMRDVGGQALLRRLRREGTRVPFIVITGQGDEHVAVELMKQGALDYLTKDTHLLEVLPAVVKRALDQTTRGRELAAAQAALRESHREILTIIEHERCRIGQDLHDSLGQQLTALEFRIHSLLEDLDAPDLASRRADLKAQTSELGRMTRDAIAQTRSLARGLSPVKLEAHGLMEALEDLARRTEALGKAHCRFECPAPVEMLEAQTAAHLFRIAQEAVANALRHAHASEIVIRLARRHGALTLTVQDNGRGFVESAKPAAGMGLSVMRHRANVLGAHLEIAATPGTGVAVTCSLPSTGHET